MLLAWESERHQKKEGCVSFYRSKFSIWKEEDAKETTNSVEKSLEKQEEIIAEYQRYVEDTYIDVRITLLGHSKK